MLQRQVELEQYTSARYAAKLAALRMLPSMGRTGICYDSSAAESFFATLKTEIGTRVWATRYQARQAVFEYIEVYCNRRRLHSRLGYRTPHEARTAYYRHEHALAA